MGFKTFVALNALFAADVNTYLMKQTVIVCTSGTRPASPVAGMTIYETDVNLYAVYNGTSWVETSWQYSTAVPAATTSTTYVTATAAVTIQTGTKVLISLSGTFTHSTAGITSYLSSSGTGATTYAGADVRATFFTTNAANYSVPMSRFVIITGLTPGSNVSTAAMKTNAGTLTPSAVDLAGIGLP